MPHSSLHLCTAARDLARQLLAGLDDRWAHTRGVAGAAERAGAGLELEDQEDLLSAAWLHDIGYSPECRRTGFHALDGAEKALECGFPQRVAALVAHHSISAYEAAVRGLKDELLRYPAEAGPVTDALTWADMTTDPQGRPTNPQDRIEEILDRYPPSDPVHQAIVAATPDILAAVERTAYRLSVTDRYPM